MENLQAGTPYLVLIESSNPLALATTCPSQDSTLHSSTNLLPITRFKQSELAQAITDMQAHLKGSISSSPNTDMSDMTQTFEAPTVRYSRNNLAEFRTHWSRGTPVTVRDVRIQGNWDPAYFVKEYGDSKVVIIDCDTDTSSQKLVQDFFPQLGQSCTRKSILKLKVSPNNVC